MTTVELGSATAAKQTLEKLVEIYGLAEVVLTLSDIAQNMSNVYALTNECRLAADYESDALKLLNTASALFDESRRQII